MPKTSNESFCQGCPAWDGNPKDDCRRRTLMTARMEGDYLPPQPVLVRRISNYCLGAISTGHLPTMNESINISLAGGIEWHGVVRHVDRNSFAVRLTAESDTHKFLQIMKRQNIMRSSAIQWQVDPRHVSPRQPMPVAAQMRSV